MTFPGALTPPKGTRALIAGQYYIFIALDDAFVTPDGRALCSQDTYLPRPEIQRPSRPAGSRPMTAFGEPGIACPVPLVAVAVTNKPITPL
mgnify:CR=1 FL=1